MFGLLIPSVILLLNVVWLCSIMSQSDMQENWFTVFNVKVTARAYIIKIWLFLLYLKNDWSIWNQTWFGSTTLWAGVSCGKIGLLYSRSQQRLKMSVNACPDDIFWTAQHFVTKRSMVTCRGKKRKEFAVFIVKVTARADMVKISLFVLYLKKCWFIGNQTWSDDAWS